MKQTAVEWLVEKIIEDKLIDVKNGHQFIHLQSIAKQMEKEQIIKAYKDGRSDLASNFHKSLNMSLEQYYNETFKNETK
jgi:hypothetical protein